MVIRPQSPIPVQTDGHQTEPSSDDGHQTEPSSDWRSSDHKVRAQFRLTVIRPQSPSPVQTDGHQATKSDPNPIQTVDHQSPALAQLRLRDIRAVPCRPDWRSSDYQTLSRMSTTYSYAVRNSAFVLSLSRYSFLAIPRHQALAQLRMREQNVSEDEQRFKFKRRASTRVQCGWSVEAARKAA